MIRLSNTGILWPILTVILFLFQISFSTGTPTPPEIRVTTFDYEINPNKTCGENYKDCIDEAAIENVVDLSKMEDSYVEACNRTLKCTAMYFECRMAQDNLTSSESPLQYPAAVNPSFKNPFEAYFLD